MGAGTEAPDLLVEQRCSTLRSAFSISKSTPDQRENWPRSAALQPPPLRIGDIFANAARAVPDRVAAALGDRALTFASLESKSNRVARALASEGVETRHAGRAPLRDEPRRGAALRRARQARGRLRADQRPARRRRSRCDRRPRAVPTWSCKSGGRSPRSKAAVVELGALVESARRLHRVAARGRRARRARPARGLLHQRQHRCAQGRGPLPPRRLPAQPSRVPCSSPGARWSARIRCSTWARGPSPSSSGRPATRWCSCPRRPPRRSSRRSNGTGRPG